jgi:hypothetical protein
MSDPIARCCENCASWIPFKRIPGYTYGVCGVAVPFWADSDTVVQTEYLAGRRCLAFSPKTSRHGAEGGAKIAPPMNCSCTPRRNHV